MPILNRAAELQEEVSGWRRQLHRRPELNFDLFETSTFVADKLREFGCDEVATGIAKTGVVGLIRGRLGDGPTIGLRSDMDALPINEASGVPHASETPGKMHACGHDGHTAMLLGAAKYLTETRNFHGTVAVIFQPAEEGGGGGRVMVKEGLMERFGIERVFGMHNAPGLPVGQFATRPGPIMASTAEFTITIKGKGGHAAFPHQTVDPIVVTSRIVGAMQSIASRSADPVDALVVSVTKFHAGDAYNVIPETAEIAGTVRTLRRETADLAEERIRALVTGIAVASGAEANIHYDRNYPVTFNHAEETDFAVDVARDVAGDAKVDPQMPAMMGGEDFSYMLEARPGSFIFVGNGDTANLHHPAYDFNDEAIPHGISYWVRLTEKALAA
ncbi:MULTISPECIES: M20 aminoacylase family protein [Nitratireductor]|uniref:M20 aminoacylase family protein n=1 Tax=Nitratireductor TaxID=245876 RepID=UPI000D0CE5D8|nr:MULTISPECIES: M20 aminoacylase family protein [Nitratireductor]PSM16202.1 amidohydrolase [Nitratireductor sp. StC3]